MIKTNICCPYCKNDIVLEYGKVKTSKKSKNKKEPKILKPKTMNDFASMIEVKKMDDLVITSLAHFYFTKKIDKVGYRDLYNNMKNADRFYKKMRGMPKNAVIRLVQNKKIEEHPNQIYSLNKKELNNIGRAIKK